MAHAKILNFVPKTEKPQNGPYIKMGSFFFSMGSIANPITLNWKKKVLSQNSSDSEELN